ncbi:hypothetical protein TNCV_2722511 [Trichonephila clavipes]|nr:hypothetical protein TNCV_2722511 [Trichonephila clavipes]
MQVTVQFGSVPPQIRGRVLWEWSGVSHLFSSSTNLTRGLAARQLFKIPFCRNGTIHLQTSKPSPGFETRLRGITVNVH